jgi:anaerobic selenocysteine-containing dehydrogenase
VEEVDYIHEKLGMKAKPEMIFGISANFVISNFDWDMAVKNFKDCFVVQNDLWINETDQAIGDLILPDVSYLEKDCWSSEIDAFFFSGSPSYEDWYVHLQKPVAKPIGESRFFMDVYIEVAHRVGVLDKFNAKLNDYYGVTDLERDRRTGPQMGVWPGQGKDRRTGIRHLAQTHRGCVLAVGDRFPVPGLHGISDP